MTAGVRINLVSKAKLESMTTQEKIRFILDEVKRDSILVLEQGLDPMEETRLIESTMIEIDPDTFTGVEYQSQRVPVVGVMAKLFRGRKRGEKASMTVVGPADKLKTVYKDGSVIEAIILEPTAKPEHPKKGRGKAAA